ncbi:MAG: hypothetical protein ABIO29_04450 [Sphingomicrobium sp.]
MEALWTAAIAAMGGWHQGKLFIEHGLAVEHDALHVLVGMLFWLVLAVVLRRPLSNWRPLLGLALLALWNEAVDLWVELWPDPGMQLGEGAKDLALTLIVPALLTWLIRARPSLFVR